MCIISRADLFSYPPKIEDFGGNKRGVILVMNRNWNKINSSTWANARKMRKELTTSEFKFWQLVHEAFPNIKFRRQHAIGPYIIDFCCLSHNLCIEIDGESHFTKEIIALDRKRTDFLISHGWNVLRFSNLDIQTNIDGVIQEIALHLKE
jgi:very-short-patch-repair endonuclease